MIVKELFPAHTENAPARTAILLSGTGSNARALLEYSRRTPCAYQPCLLVTDNPRSRAGALAEEFGLPLAELDIRNFYASAGENSIKLDTPERRELRARWSSILYDVLRIERIELVLFAGFIPMTNLTEKLPCLNVHPGDLTVTLPDNSRPFAGLHYKPVEEALCRGIGHTRSSVILAQPYSGSGKAEMDSGPVIAVSPRIPFAPAPEGISWPEIRAARTAQPPRDLLRTFAEKHIEKMKLDGDHVIFPRAADDFARGRFLCDETGKLFYREGDTHHPILSVEYTLSGKDLLKDRCDR